MWTLVLREGFFRANKLGKTLKDLSKKGGKEEKRKGLEEFLYVCVY